MANQTNKRILVDADNIERVIPDARRNQYTLDPARKLKVLTALIHMHVTLADKYGCINKLNNITIMSRLTSVITTLHHALRQGANSEGGLEDKIVSPLKIENEEASIAIDKVDLGNAMARILKMYGFEYTAGNTDANHWYGMMAPYLTYFSAFNLRLNEVRTGCEYFVAGKKDNDYVSVRVSQYGLSGVHHPYLQGITYPPTKRSSLAQSVGPLTQLITLARTTDTKFQSKWVSALTRSINHIPRHSEIIEACRGKRANEIMPLVSVLADILLITGSRTGHKAFFPISFFLSQLTAGVINSMKTDPPTAPSDIPNFISKIDFSGRGAFLFYSKACNHDYIMNFEASANDVREIVFHATFGSHWEDLNVLQFMTDYTFKNRRELGPAFRGKGTTANQVLFKPIPVLKYAKLSQALPTEFTSGGQTQIINCPVFAGKRNTNIGKVFLNHFTTSNQPSSSVYGTGNLVQFLSNYKMSLLRKVAKNRSIAQGTVTWRSTQGLGDETVGNEVNPPAFHGPPRLFMGPDEQPMEAEQHFDDGDAMDT